MRSRKLTLPGVILAIGPAQLAVMLMLSAFFE